MKEYINVSNQENQDSQNKIQQFDKYKTGKSNIHVENINVKMEIFILIIFLLLMEAIEITVAFNFIPQSKFSMRIFLILLLLPFILLMLFVPFGISVIFDYVKKTVTIYQYPILRFNYSCSKTDFLMNDIKCFKIKKLFYAYLKLYSIAIVDTQDKETDLFGGQDVKGCYCCSDKFDPKLDELEKKLNDLLNK